MGGGGGILGQAGQIGGALTGGALAGIPGIAAGTSLGGSIGGANADLLPRVNTDGQQNIANAGLGAFQQSQNNINQLQPQQQQFGQQLAQGALGQGPSIAGMQLQQGLDQNLAQMQGAALANRGINPALAARQVAMQGAANTQAMQGQAAIGRLEEQRQQQAAFGNYLGQQNQQAANYLGAASGAQQAVNNTQTQNANRGTQALGGILGGASSALGFLAKYDGGEIPPIGKSGPQSNFGKCYKQGGEVPGKAAVAGNDPKNDTVKAMLSPGEVVIPRDVMSSKDPAEAAKKFVAAILAKKGKK